MGLELAQVAAGLPMALSFALAGGIGSLREGRRRSVLNEAMHELRRPLQVLSLSLPVEEEGVDSSLQMVSAALQRLDREINGAAMDAICGPVRVRELVDQAVGRWRVRVIGDGGRLRLRWLARDPIVVGDGIELAAALDNLISNAVEHGGGRVTIEVREQGRKLHLAILDEGDARGAGARRAKRTLLGGIGGRRRRGHGLRVVERVAASHGGRFELRRSPGGTEARLELPMGWRAR
jgi:signal transduction histidine kinase